jgi:hypothetical protein
MHKCYYTYDEKTLKKVLIPLCWSVVISNDIEDCICANNNNDAYIHKSYNDDIKKLKGIIDCLHKEVSSLVGQLEKANEKLKR